MIVGRVRPTTGNFHVSRILESDVGQPRTDGTLYISAFLRNLDMTGAISGYQDDVHPQMRHRSNDCYFLRFLSRVRSSFIDIVGSFRLSSMSFQNFDEA